MRRRVAPPTALYRPIPVRSSPGVGATMGGHEALHLCHRPGRGLRRGRPLRTVQEAGGRPAPPPFTVVEATIPEMRAAMEQGRVTSKDLVRESLLRIAIYEERLNAVMR